MRLLHTMLRIGSVDQTLKFYCDGLGMELQSQKDYPAGEFTLFFVGYPGDDKHELEFTYNYGREKYELGEAFGHIAVGCDDIEATCKKLAEFGGTITRTPGPMKHGSTVIAFVRDPSGYMVELIEESSRARKQ